MWSGCRVTHPAHEAPANELACIDPPLVPFAVCGSGRNPARSVTVPKFDACWAVAPCPNVPTATRPHATTTTAPAVTTFRFDMDTPLLPDAPGW
jgi:hypothetical protein